MTQAGAVPSGRPVRFVDDLNERPRRSNVIPMAAPANVRRRVVIADDAPAIRLLFRRILENSSSFEVVGEAADGGEAVRLAEAEHPDLVLLDLAMPVLDGLEAIPEVRRCSPETRIVVLSGFDAGRMENEALACGADAYIEKRLRPDVLLERILEACDGPLHATAAPGLTSAPTPPIDARLAVTLEHAPNGMALGGLNGRFHSVNEAFCELLGYTQTELLERTFAQVSERSDVEAEARLQEQLFAHEIPSYQVEHRFIDAKGPVVWTLVSRSLLPSDADAPVEVITQVIDRTELNQVQARHLRAETARERYARELSRTNAELAEFATVAAHDLKSPLQLITGFASLLEHSLGDALDDAGREYIGWILEGGRTMDGIISDLLAYAMVGAADPVSIAVDLEDVMVAARSDLESSIVATGAAVTWDALPAVTGDPVQLTDLFRHLLSNALKFVAPDIEPVVHIRAARTQDGWRIEVADNGIGIDPADAASVFTMFHRLHPKATYAGSGVGLAVCKRIVERHGGEIDVEPGVDGGSRFSFTIPDAQSLNR